MKKKNETEPVNPAETAADLPETGATAGVMEAEAGQPDGTPSETDMLKDRLVRLQADFDNFRKRSARERAEWQVYALEQLIQDILPVVDHYELGLATAEKQRTAPAVLDGFRLVYDQMLGVLKRHGVSPVSAPPGSVFDPHRQEAISHVASEEHSADTIIAETRKGYVVGDKMIRPLQVVVSSGPGTSGEADGN